MSFIDVGQDLDAYLTAPVSLIIFGDPGAGKTSAIASVSGAQNCLWVVSSKKELRGYASLLKMKRAEAAALKAKGLPIPDDLARDAARTMPTKVLEVAEYQKGLAEIAGDGKAAPQMLSQRISNEQIVQVIVDAYLKRLTKDPDAYSGIVFSSWSIIAKRIHDDMMERMGKGWDVGREIHRFHRWLMREVPQVSGKSLILDCHKREPDFDKGGALTTMGGPLLPTGPLGKPVAGEADFVFEYRKEVVETGDKLDGTWRQEESRIFLCDSDPQTVRKRRDFRINAIERGTLEEVLAKGDVVIR